MGEVRLHCFTCDLTLFAASQTCSRCGLIVTELELQNDPLLSTGSCPGPVLGPGRERDPRPYLPQHSYMYQAVTMSHKCRECGRTISDRSLQNYSLFSTGPCPGREDAAELAKEGVWMQDLFDEVVDVPLVLEKTERTMPRERKPDPIIDDLKRKRRIEF